MRCYGLIFLSVCLTDWLPVSLFFCVYLSVCLTTCLPVCLSVCLSVVCLEIYYHFLAVYYKISCLAQSWPNLRRDVIIKCLGDAGFNARTLVSYLCHWARIRANKERLIELMIDWCIDWLIDWLTDWLVGRRAVPTSSEIDCYLECLNIWCEFIGSELTKDFKVA